ncbi:HAD-IIB family hydrolase [Bifidobacterium callimiconis]|uniref:phosphomannomutase n=1 Tax=Bifidobacterium callimiconis TaxID=2306973 RepID=A0A430FIC4_9BIFI|nr:HAD-IIB family hydrolase [Bifidobacterium callimiconis]MBT1176309.1 HAD-IIB family hydrolase [Bifidobacterium callimiconis]RSX52567.1 haloacid dehalogenase [Bifidobacterium callimiconis]
MGDVMIHRWDEVDYDRLGGLIDAVGFDLDTTLAKSKTPMTRDMADAFAELTHHIPCAVVSGGKYHLFTNQILAMIGDKANRRNLHLMPTSGTRYYAWNGSAWQCRYAHDLSPEDRDAAIASLTRHAKEQGLWLPDDRIWGDRLEDRGSQITFSALGQLAPVAAKEAWDPDRAKKNRLAAAVAADLPQLTVRSGGSTSVDVVAKGIDKAYAMHQLSTILNVPIGRIAFIGDRMDPDGNDYPTAVAGAYAIRVTCPDDTLEAIRRLTAVLSLTTAE